VGVNGFTLHETEVREPQLPESTCILGVEIPEPTDPSVIVGLVVFATNRYHTSYWGVPPQPAGEAVVIAAFRSVPATGPQVEPETSKAELSNSSFAGGFSRHILKP
jgi:hypothetical protein